MLVDLNGHFLAAAVRAVSQTLYDLKSVNESLLLNYQCKTSGASEVGSIWTSWSLYIRLWTTFIHQEGKMKKKLIRENIFPHDRFVIPITFAQLLHFFLNPAYQYPLLSILYSEYSTHFAYCAYHYLLLSTTGAGRLLNTLIPVERTNARNDWLTYESK